MSFQDRISHAAAVTKWKADQQMRLLKSQNQVRDFENQIKSQKALLADKALNLFTQHLLAEEALIQVCTTIAHLHEQIKEQQSIQELAKQERAPELITHSADYPEEEGEATIQPTPGFSGLVCPKCNRSLIGRFCPEHGVEGIEPPQISELQQANETATQLMCPECKKLLSVRFCPEHGVEGIPALQNQGE